MLSEHPHLAVMRRTLDAFRSGDLPALAQILSADVVWRVPGRSFLAKDYKGHEEVFGFFERLIELTSGTWRLVRVQYLVVLGRCLAIAATLACAGSAMPGDDGPTYVSPGGTGPTTIDGIDYEYVAAAEREARITAGFRTLKIGQSRKAVRAALGPPDTVTPLHGKAADAPLLGWSYMYKIRMRSGGPNTNDICVEVFFDPHDELRWAVPNHIDGLGDVGSPTDQGGADREDRNRALPDA